MPQMESVRQLFTRLGVIASHPGAFGVVILYAILWYAFARDTLDWHAVTTLIVWCMTLLIQRAEHRDTQALQAKLDELCVLNIARTMPSRTLMKRSLRILSAIERRHLVKAIGYGL